MMTQHELVKLLACPKCRGELRSARQGDSRGFECPSCGVVYPIRDEIPIMLADEAIDLEKWRGKAEN